MMDDKKLEEMYELVRENNSMLRSARRAAFVGGIFKFAFWIFVLVVLPYLAWLYLQPYLETIMLQYQQLQNQSGAISAQAQSLQEQLNSFPGLSDIFKQFTGGGE